MIIINDVQVLDRRMSKILHEYIKSAHRYFPQNSIAYLLLQKVRYIFSNHETSIIEKNKIIIELIAKVKG